MKTGGQLYSDIVERGRRCGLAICIIVGGLAITAGAAVVQCGRQSLAAVNRQAQAVDRDWVVAARRVQAAINLRQAQQTLMGHADCAQALLEKTPRSTVLADVTNALPAGSWLITFTLDSTDSDSSARVGADEDLRMAVTGFAPGDAAVGQFIMNLQESRLLHDVKLAACESATEHGVGCRRFRIDMRIGGPMRPTTPAAPPTLTASVRN